MGRASIQLYLVPVGNSEYAEFAEQQIAEYARQHVNAGEWGPGKAQQLARSELTDLLNDSLRRAGHVFLKGTDGKGERVGWLWVAPAPEFLGDDRDRKRWLAQITVDPTLRGRGYGRALLAALHHWLIAEAVEELWLRVYDWNEAARRMYAAAGYEVVRQFPNDAHLRRQLTAVCGDATGGGG